MNRNKRFSIGNSPAMAISAEPGFTGTFPPLPTGPAPPAPSLPQEPAFARPAYIFLMGFLFVATSRVLDFTFPSLHLPLILAVLAAALTFISYGIKAAFSTSVGRMMGLFALWFVVCVPFSDWKQGSLDLLMDELSRSFLVFVMVATAINTVRKLQGLMAIIGSGIVITMIIALTANQRVDGRLTMSGGQYSNPNDLAQAMLLGMCFLPVLGAWMKSRILRGISYLMMIPFLYTIFITGSRSALIAVVILAGVVFFFAPTGKKLLLAVLFPILGIGLLAVSDTAWLRLAAILDDDATEVVGSSEEIAVSSASARLITLQQSLEITLQNPLFGVGPGVFESAAADMSGSEGRRALWVQTHNSYTQVSSETGIPGALLFCGAVLFSLKELLRIRKRTNGHPQFKDLHYTVSFMLLGFLTFTTTSIFSSMAYSFLFWMLLGLCSAGISVLNRELETAAASASAPATVPLAAPGVRSGSPVFPAVRPSLDQPPATRVTLSGRIKPSRRALKPSAGVSKRLRG